VKPLFHPRHLLLAVVASTLLAAGGGLIARPVAHAVIGTFSAAQAERLWEKWKRAFAVRDGAAPVAPGEPMFWLRVPSCKMSTLVLRESDAEALHRFPAARPLDSGGCVVFAHRDLHFHPLAGIRVGDAINVEKADGRTIHYAVRTIRILLPEQIPATLAASEFPYALHLLTCYPFRYFGAAPKRFLVTATERTDRVRP
jgi:sortase A